MTFEFSIKCEDNILEDGGCTFTEVSVSRFKTASSYILVMLMSIFIPDYIADVSIFLHPISLSHSFLFLRILST